MKRRTAVLVFLPSIDETKQQRALLRWCEERRYTITSLTHQPAAAVALAEAGLVDAVVVLRHNRSTLELAGRLALTTEVTVDEVRPSSTPIPRGDGTHARIVDAARRGVDAAAISAVLDVPLATVHEALGLGAQMGGAAVGRPSVRRPIRMPEARVVSSARRPARSGRP